MAAKYQYSPPSVYSAEANYWLFEMMFPVLHSQRDIGVFYVHTTDFPMHHWGPEDRESLDHLRKIDTCLEETVKHAPDAGIIVTADHGMTKKTTCVNLAKICAMMGAPVARAISPVANRMMAHHGGFGGVSYIYLNEERDRERVRSALLGAHGVEDILDGSEAARRFDLPEDLLGDLVVLADRETVFGNSREAYEELPQDYRGHGSLHESSVPLIAFNIEDGGDCLRHATRNYELTEILFNTAGSMEGRVETAPAL